MVAADKISYFCYVNFKVDITKVSNQYSKCSNFEHLGSLFHSSNKNQNAFQKLKSTQI